LASSHSASSDRLIFSARVVRVGVARAGVVRVAGVHIGGGAFRM
jgi:hypothetical protein